MRRHQYETGITYLAVLMLVAVMGAGLAATGIIWKTAQQREKERDLLFIGDQFRTAIMLYYENTSGPVKQYPKSLNDLLRDERHPSLQRYLRKIYVDPITRKKEWGLVTTPTGGIMGVYSFSDEPPLKTEGFSAKYQAMEGKGKYSEWRFFYQPRQQVK